MPELRFRGSDGATRSVTVTIQASRDPAVPAGWTLVERKTLTSGNFRPAPRTEYRDCVIGWLESTSTSRENFFRRCAITGFDLGQAWDTELVDCVIGPMTGAHPALGWGPGSRICQDITFRRCRFHGMHQANVDDHTEGIQIRAGRRIRFLACTFDDNHIFNAFVRTSGPIDDVLFDACAFGPVGGIAPGAGAYSARVSADSSPVPSNVRFVNCRRPANQPISIDGACLAAGCSETGTVAV